jgi:(E)-4-hydroxy-3-methylbut-2-enyl-diphosphate synthase
MCAYISKVVNIGGLLIGGSNPIRIQSMINTDTLNTEATVGQCLRMIEAGCELIRITAQGVKEAENLKEIRRRLHSKGYIVPLIADIHFNPKAAEVAATIVEKVRINPGNYNIQTTRSAKFGNGYNYQSDFTEYDYQNELDNITVNLKPLIKICKQHGTAIRIGVNHGSLSNRIVSRYGDTVEGMVESALEYARICGALNFNNLVLSVKSSNTVVMLNAYRELALRLQHENLNFPLHIGVTEAGNGDDGRMKSIAGIGAVLAHGIGDTIRVSLTEDPEKELPVAIGIVKKFSNVNSNGLIERRIRGDLQMKSIIPEYSNDRKTNETIEVFVSVNGNIFSVSANGKIQEMPPESYLSVTVDVEDNEFAQLVIALKGEFTKARVHKISC